MSYAPTRLLPALGLLASLSACAAPGCRNPYVLDFVNTADHRADLSHLGLVRDAVRSDPGATPQSESCTIWERVRNPAYGTAANQPEALLRPQRFEVTRISDGWRVEGLQP